MIVRKKSNAKKTAGNDFPTPGNAEPQLGFKSKREDAKSKDAEQTLSVPRLDSGRKEEFTILEVNVTRHLERMGFR